MADSSTARTGPTDQPILVAVDGSAISRPDRQVPKARDSGRRQPRARRDPARVARLGEHGGDQARLLPGRDRSLDFGHRRCFLGKAGPGRGGWHIP